MEKESVELIEYNIDSGVKAFTAGRGVALPFEVVQPHQVHGYNTAIIRRPGVTREELEGYDALVTNVPNCAIGVRSADCVPILLYDPIHRAVAAIHAGWKGTMLRICQKTMFCMQSEYGTVASDLKALIGPCICGKCFQVGEDVVTAFKETGFRLEEVYQWNGGKTEGDMKTGHHIDLVAANRILLQQEGVREDNIHVSGICTYETPALYSARREGSECGRNINAIMLLS